MLKTDFTIAGMGRILLVESDLPSLSAAWSDFRDRHNIPSSEVLAGGTVSEDGRAIGTMSYNGKVWAGEWQPGDQPLYDPYAGPPALP